MPAPSPVSGSAPVAPRCSMLHKAPNPVCTMRWLATPLTCTTNDTPHESCSKRGSYKPCADGKSWFTRAALGNGRTYWCTHRSGHRDDIGPRSQGYMGNYRRPRIKPRGRNTPKTSRPRLCEVAATQYSSPRGSSARSEKAAAQRRHRNPQAREGFVRFDQLGCCGLGAPVETLLQRSTQ